MNKKEELKILVCCHKKDLMLTSEPYLPIQVGKAVSKIDLGIQGDDEGDNISKENPYYAELSAMYWAWKNLKGVEYVGLCHYRRYFDFHNQCNNQLSAARVFPASMYNELDYSVPSSVISKLKDGYVIMPIQSKFPVTLFDQYDCYDVMRKKDLLLAEEIIMQQNNKDIIDAYNKIIRQGNHMRVCNMFIMCWRQFDEYCNWVFGLFDEMKDRINFDELEKGQERVFGFMGERLLNVFVEAKHYKIKEYPSIWFTDDDAYPYIRKPLLGFITSILRNFRNWMYNFRNKTI